ncbi:hypothetical protein Mgra_00007878 [Meloidogyne graminicola]|uniref:Uncharacterized protein n=1 Tax=Meloidogyne graminicola TaxID=189291 RepID=A0A8S9ZHP7_9BILA|nr:hypothetical protein Mgra_00007878 [Meloidogyne graminicola]
MGYPMCCDLLKKCYSIYENEPYEYHPGPTFREFRLDGCPEIEFFMRDAHAQSIVRLSTNTKMDKGVWSCIPANKCKIKCKNDRIVHVPNAYLLHIEIRQPCPNSASWCMKDPLFTDKYSCNNGI